MSILIILNNYLHDVATALLLSSAVILTVLARRARSGGPDVQRWFADAYRVLTRFAWGALVWIIVGGIPRTIFFNQYEFIPADTKGIVADLIIKHVVLVTSVIVGAVMWIRVGRAVKAAEQADPGR